MQLTALRAAADAERIGCLQAEMNVGDVMSDTTILIAALENAPGVIIPLIREVSPQFLKRRPSPTKWSAHEHACHLSASDGPFLARLDLMLSAPAPFIRSILNSPEVESGALLSVDLVVLKQSLSFSSDAVRAPQLKASVSQTHVELDIK